MSLTPAEQGQLLAVLNMAEAIQHLVQGILAAHAPPADPPGAAAPEVDANALPPLLMGKHGLNPQ